MVSVLGKKEKKKRIHAGDLGSILLMTKILNHFSGRFYEFFFPESDGRPLVARNEIVSSYYSYFLDKFCARDISRTIHRFFFKLSGMMRSYMPLLILEEFWNNSLLVPSYGHFPDFKMKFCQFEI